MTEATMENGAIGFADVRDGKVKNPEAVALASIAISMKRIADQLAGVPYNTAPGADNAGHRLGLVDGIMHAIEQGIVTGSTR